MKCAQVVKIDEHTYIRPCSLRFKRKFKEIVLRALAEYGFRYDPQLNHDLDYPEKVYRKGKGDFFVILHKRKVVGTFAVQDLGKGRAYWRRLAIAKKYRGRGWGVAAQRYATDFSRSAGFTRATFDTLKETGMYRKYTRFGFKVMKESREGKFKKLFMAKDLAK